MNGVGHRWIWPLLVLIGLVAAWDVGVRLSETEPWLLPRPGAVVETFWQDRSLLWRHTLVTLREVLFGFGLAVVAGVLLAVAIDRSVVLERALYPLVIASQTIPIPALAPLLLVWFGYGLLPKVLVTALVGFFPIAVNTIDGLRSTDRGMIELLRSLGASRWMQLRLVRFPSALPAVFSGARVTVAVCVIGAVFGELVGSSAGLGYLMNRSRAQLQTDRVIACIVLLALMAVVLFALVALAERVLLPWRRLTVGEGSHGG